MNKAQAIAFFKKVLERLETKNVTQIGIIGVIVYDRDMDVLNAISTDDFDQMMRKLQEIIDLKKEEHRGSVAAKFN